MGHCDRLHRGFSAEGAAVLDAAGVRQSNHAGQAGDEKRVRVPVVQNANARSHVYLDVQPEDPRQAHQVDLGRRGDSSADLSDGAFTRELAIVTVSPFFFFF